MSGDSSTVPGVLSQTTARRLRTAAAKAAAAEAERDWLIVEASKGGASLREIAAQVGVSYVTVRNIIRKHVGSDS